MKNLSRKQDYSNVKIMGEHIQKHRILMMVVLGVISLIQLVFLIFWNYDENSFGNVADNIYLISDIVLLSVSLIILVCLILNGKNIISIFAITIILHVYSFIVMVCGTTTCIIDLINGLNPFIFLLVSTMISGLFIINPFFFGGIVTLSFIAIMLGQIWHPYAYFTSAFKVENIIDFIAYVAVVIVICIRHFNVTMREHSAYKKIEEMSYKDELTGLLNERSYVNETESIDKNIVSNSFKDFAVILMDVNNLKATNDAYGHRYGCHLIVHCGHILPTIFKSSKLFHVGGDEFIVIVYGEDFINFEERIKEFDEKCCYGFIEYEGVNLIFSVARGYAKCEEGMKYKDVLQIADKAMYENKAEIKQTYNMKAR